MKNLPLALAMAGVLSLGACGGGAGGGVSLLPDIERMPPAPLSKVAAIASTLTTLDYTQSSAIRTARTAAIQSQAELTALWAEHRPGRGAPDVDFASRTVLAVFTGEQPDNCHQSHILKTEITGGKLVVTYAERAPMLQGGTAMACATAVVYPAVVVSVPRFTGPIEFVKADAPAAQLIGSLDFDWNSAIGSTRNVALSTQTEWAALWAETRKNASPAPALPAVDFATHNVIGFFSGPGYSQCTRPVFERSYPLADRIVVEYAYTILFSNTCPYDQSYGVLATVPKADLPYEFRRLPDRSMAMPQVRP